MIPDLNVLDVVEAAPGADFEAVDAEVPPAHARHPGALPDFVPLKSRDMRFNTPQIA